MKREASRRFGCVFLSFAFFIAMLSFTSQVRAALEKDSCEKIIKIRQLFQCILRNHPELQRSEADIAISKASSRIARERPNPELESKQVFGLPGSEESLTSEINLTHTLELGAKRKARIQKSQAYQSLISSQHIALQERAILEAVISLYRLRQLKSEKEAFNESLQTFQHIQSIYQKRPILDPEQKASLALFQFAEREINLKKADLVQEEIELTNNLEKWAGQALTLTPYLLPKPIKQWPLSQSNENSLSQSALMQKRQAEVEDAKASYLIAKSEAWPNLKLGPSLEIQNQREGNSTSLGFNFALPLPLYNQNQGRKEQALLEQKKSELNVRLTQTEIELEKKKNLQEYHQTLKLLKAYQVSLQTSGKHQEIESFFERGLVSSSLVLEMHRQLIESTQAYHAQEMKALEVLWSLYVLEGRILQEKDKL